MISVCMATYNGETYLKPQIDSILRNLSSNDELIISDDGSTDKTIEYIYEYLKKDPRVKLLEGPRKGFVKNFENAMNHSKGKYIFLADQDDIWSDNKVHQIMQCFSKSNATLIVHDCQIINEQGEVIEPSFFALKNSGPGVLHNLIKNSYIGCCMAFDRNLLEAALPIPSEIPFHDEWLGLVNDVVGQTVFLPQVLFSYRRHGSNVSSMHHSSIINMIKSRYIFYTELHKRTKQIKKHLKSTIF